MVYSTKTDKAPPLTHAANVAVHADIVESVLGGLDFTRIRFRVIAHIEHSLLSERGVIVEVDLGINTVHLKCRIEVS